nr:hypothetical protein Iba_chr07eCG2700 [Ipomoea batatas]
MFPHRTALARAFVVVPWIGISLHNFLAIFSPSITIVENINITRRLNYNSRFPYCPTPLCRNSLAFVFHFPAKRIQFVFIKLISHGLPLLRALLEFIIPHRDRRILWRGNRIHLPVPIRPIRLIRDITGRRVIRLDSQR